jgi:flagellar hook-basal body complex protein FliE
MISGIAPINSLSKGSDGFATMSSTSAASAGVNPGQSFAAMVSETANRTIDTLQAAEQVSIKALQGDADARQVADAVMNAEQSLQAAVAIRDKIVTAYLEISRMAI